MKQPPLRGAPFKVTKKLGRFDDIVAEAKATGKVNREMFRSSEEVGMFMDYYNQVLREKRHKDGDGMIHEISVSLVKSMYKKSFLVNSTTTKDNEV